MANKINEVNAVTKRVRSGYSEGIDPLSHKQIPELLARIDELERALQPFARIAINYSKFPQELVHAYLDDCNRAYAMLDSRQSVVPKQAEFEQPAE